MKMRTFRSNMLYRDKVVTMLTAAGSIVHSRVLDDAAYDLQLRKKLLEEADEANKTSTKKDLIEELADVYEVIDALCQLHTIDKQEIINLQLHKRNKKGGFAGRTFVEVAQHPVGSAAESYFLASDKHPEVTE